MKILVACEFSGIVRDAFIKKGHDAISCDILPTESPGPHIHGDVLHHLNAGWDLMIAHPPCTYLSVSGNRWMKDDPVREYLRLGAIEFFMKLVNAPIHKIAVENPISIMSTRHRKPDQYVQPFEYGHKETKKTSLWLKNLPLLKPTNIVEPEYIIGKDGKRYSRIHYMSNGNKDRAKERSLTYHGIAKAMAEQWG